MNSTTWRTAAVLTLLGLAACKGTQESEAPAKQETAATAAPKQPAQPGEAKQPAAPAPATAKAVVGQPAPDFRLPDLDGREHALADYRGKTVVLEWFSPACPYCVAAYSEGGALTELPERLVRDGVVWLSVNSQNAKHPGANVEKNKAFVEKYHLEAPILLDPAGTVGRAYGAKTTPHCFVIDAKGVLVYAGGLDNAPNGQTDGGAPVVNYVEAAVADLKAGRPVATSSSRSYG